MVATIRGPARKSAVHHTAAGAPASKAGKTAPAQPKIWGAVTRSNDTFTSAAPIKPMQAHGLPTGIHDRLAQFYSSEAGYRAVKNAVVGTPDAPGWYGTKHLGCAAFASEALRQVGVNIPRPEFGDDKPLASNNFALKNKYVSLDTPLLRDYLRNELKWQTLSKTSDLKPGDVVFTKPDDGNPDHPAHVYIFAGWTDQKRGIANVIDNQSAKHQRNVNQSTGTFHFTPFAFALRAPEAQ